MRINKFVAQATGLSRRAADKAIQEGRVVINQHPAELGSDVGSHDKVVLDGQHLTLAKKTTVTIMLNKPVGYVCSREGQGSRTIYDLLPADYQSLKPVGRLDKDSSGLLLVTNDGDLTQKLTHPSYNKEKIYEVELDKPLDGTDLARVVEGVELEDGLSRMSVTKLDNNHLRVVMHEGRNRQIRRTFAAVGYKVIKLHRTQSGDYQLGKLRLGDYAPI